MIGKMKSLDGAMMTADEQRNLKHINIMSNILGIMIEHEDSGGTAMTQEQIVGAVKVEGFDTENVLFEMLDLAYVVCSVVVSPEERSKNVQVKSVCYSWGTTFFGREWYSGSKNRKEGTEQYK
jgi:hypothetical protein